MSEFKKFFKLEGDKGYRIVREKRRKEERGKLTQEFLEISGLVFGIGFVISVPILVGAFLGTYLDRRLNLAPKMTLCFIFMGVFLGISNLYRIVKSVYKKK